MVWLIHVISFIQRLGLKIPMANSLFIINIRTRDPRTSQGPFEIGDWPKLGWTLRGTLTRGKCFHVNKVIRALMFVHGMVTMFHINMNCGDLQLSTQEGFDQFSITSGWSYLNRKWHLNRKQNPKVSFDHMDPSIFTVLTAPSLNPGEYYWWRWCCWQNYFRDKKLTNI